MRYPNGHFRRPSRGGGQDPHDPPAADALRQAQALQCAGWARLVYALLDEALDETEKKVFTLHYGDDLPLDAITRLLGLSNRSGAKAYILRARRKLRRAARLWKARQDALNS